MINVTHHCVLHLFPCQVIQIEVKFFTAFLYIEIVVSMGPEIYDIYIYFCQSK